MALASNILLVNYDFRRTGKKRGRYLDSRMEDVSCGGSSISVSAATDEDFYNHNGFYKGEDLSNDDEAVSAATFTTTGSTSPVAVSIENFLSI